MGDAGCHTINTAASKDLFGHKNDLTLYGQKQAFCFSLIIII